MAMNNNGYFYQNATPNMQKPRMINPLTDEEAKALQTQQDKFSLSFTMKETGEAICTHKGDGIYSVVPNKDGSVTCTRCHTTFWPDECTPEYVDDTVRRMQNVLETMKFLAVDLSEDVIRSFFMVGAYINKVPQLYKLVNNSFNQYNNSGMFGGNVQAANNAQNVFAAYNSIMSPANPVYGGNPYMQQQAMMGTPQYVQQPGNPFYGQVAPQQQAAPWGYPQQAPMNQAQVMPNAQTQPVVEPQKPVQPQTVMQQPIIDSTAQVAPKDVEIKQKLTL